MKQKDLIYKTKVLNTGVFCARARARLLFCLCLLAPAALPQSRGGEAASPPQSPYGREIEDLRSMNPEVLQRAEKLLVEAGAQVAPELLRQTSPRLRFRVQGILIKIGAQKTVPVLIELLEDPATRSQAGGHLAVLIGPESSGEAARLLSCLRRLPQAAGYCGQALVKAVGPKAKAQVELLAQALEDPQTLVRVYAAAGLGRIGPRAGKAVPALVLALKDHEPAVRRSAALALGRMREKVREARKALEEVLGGPDAESRREVEAAMRDLDG